MPEPYKVYRDIAIAEKTMAKERVERTTMQRNLYRSITIDRLNAPR